MSTNEETLAGKLRPLNILRDLPAVADLVELCFQKNLDYEGRGYIQEMRSASQDRRYLKWVSNAMPLKGYVWEAEKKIVGNISIVPFKKANQNVILLANIAVHPAYRRRGIATQLTRQGIAAARQRAADSLWLHVEKNNRGAISLYEKLGFRPHSLRTTWVFRSHPLSLSNKKPASVTTHTAHFWKQEKIWLEEYYPAEIRWYRMPAWEVFQPGIKHWLYRLFVEYNVRQWAVQKNGKPQALIHWIHSGKKRMPFWLVASPQADAESVATLLTYIRDRFASPQRTLSIDCPADRLISAFEKAQFKPQRTLLWMKKSLTE